MGCGCGGGSRAGGDGSTRTVRRTLTKTPGYTWNGPEDEATTDEAAPADETADTPPAE